MKEFADKVAVVTGAASGIGRAMAERFAAEGMKVVLSDIDEAGLRAVEGELKSTGADVIAITADVTKAEDNSRLARGTFETYGAVHLLCLNAGVGTHLSTLWNQTPENWDWVLGVNLWGVIHGVREFVPRMIEQEGESRVVITSSMSGFFAMPLNSAYHVAKFAVQGFAEALHFELEMQKTSVRVTALCPGMVRTRFMDFDKGRPPEHKPMELEPGSKEAEWFEAYTEMIEGGMPPEKVVDSLMEAIKEDRFWVFPSTVALGAVEARTRDILTQRNPKIALTETLKKRLKIE